MRIRILYLIDELDLGGTEQQLLELLTELDRARYEPHVVCFRDRGRIAEELTARGIPVTLVPKRRAIDPIFLLRLIRSVRATRPHLVQTFLFTANTWGRLAAWCCRVPVIIASERNVDAWKGWRYRFVDRRLAKITTCVVTNAEAIKQFLVEDERISHPDIRVIANGIRAERVQAMPMGHRPDGMPVIGMIGRLEPQKDHLTCFRALARLRQAIPGVRLRVVGDGSLRAVLEREARVLGIHEAIEFVGSTRDVAAALASVDLLVVSSTREGCANVILEAMAAGVPVVATAVGGNPELIEDGISGLLVPPRHPDALAHAMRRVLEDRALAQALSHHARERVRSKCSISTMVTAYDQLYQRLWSPPIRIAYVIDDLGEGGAQRQLALLAAQLPRDRFAPHLISLSTTKARERPLLHEAGVPVTTIAQRGTWSWSCLWQLVKALRAIRPHIVHTWLFTADLYGRVAARAIGVPIVVSSVRSIDLEKPRHHIVVDRWLSRLTDAITINAEAERAILCTRERVSPSRLRTIYNGVDTEVFHPALRDGPVRAHWQTPKEAFVIGFVGRLSPEKNPQLFLDMASRVAPQLPQSYFWLIGQGPLRRTLEQTRLASGLSDRVRFLGHQSNIDELLPAIDLFVVPSRYEGCANVILEAMALGKPVVATRVGGNPELVRDGETGLLVAADAVGELTEAITRLARDRALARTLGQAGRASVLQRFRISQMVDAHVQLYRELLSKKCLSPLKGDRHFSRREGRRG